MILIQVCNWRKSHQGCMKTFKTSFQLFLYSTAWTFNVIWNAIIFNSVTPIVSAGVKLCGSSETSLILEVHLTYVIQSKRVALFPGFTEIWADFLEIVKYWGFYSQRCHPNHNLSQTKVYSHQWSRGILCDLHTREQFVYQTQKSGPWNNMTSGSKRGGTEIWCVNTAVQL